MTDQPAAPRPNQSAGRRKLLRRLLILVIVLLLGIPGGFLFARMIRIPLVDTLDTYRPDVITRLYTRDGELLAEYSIQRRILVRKKEMAPAVVNAIIATEDSSFYQHSGIDPRGILRAARTNVLAGRKVEGASTLTQQLAKMLFLTPEKSWRRKINEMFLAFEIEKNLTKDQILELYANQVIFGHGAYGVESASRMYFGKQASELTIAEAATLAGLIRRPEYYSPINNPDNALRRRNHVLRRMLAEGYINEEEYERAVVSPIVLGSYEKDVPRVGAYFSEEVRQYLEKNYGTEGLYRNGLEVFTTLDLKIQQAAEESLKKGLRRYDHRRGFRKPARNIVSEGMTPEEFSDPSWKKQPVENELYPAVVLSADRRAIRVRFRNEDLELPPKAWEWTRKQDLSSVLHRGDLVQVRYETDPKNAEARTWYLEQLPQVQGAVVVLDTQSGEVRALVGGYDFHASKFNRAVQSLRQVGSAFKPFVYGAALEKGFTLGDTVIDAPVAIPVGRNIYSPRNYDGEYNGLVTLQRALELSMNVPAVKTYMMTGGENVVDFTRRLGVTAPLPQYPSLALGAAGISPLELTAAYNVFANQGVYVKPRLIRKITDATQKVLEENYAELSGATSAQTAYLMSYALQATVDRGTAYAAHDLPGTLAGKTGTTNGFTDAWFVGFSPEYVMAVWVGYDDPSRTLGGSMTGAVVALPIWIETFKQMHEMGLTKPEKTFEQPPGMITLPMELKTGRRGQGDCGRVVQEVFIAGTEPDRNCNGELVAVSRTPPQLQPTLVPEPVEGVPPPAGVEVGETTN